MKKPTGFVAFTIVWAGQIVSVLATFMTNFAITLWVYEKTEKATALALAQVFFITPFLLISPVAGVMVDRHNRKLMMMLSDLGAGLATVGLLVLQALGLLDIWHLYVANAIIGTFQAFQWPAYSAAITVMVPKEQYGRANGMMALVEAGPGVIAPLLAGAVWGFIGLTGIMLIDVVTFVLAIAALLVVAVPQPPVTEAGRRGQGNILKEAWYGFQYIFERPSLLGLQIVFLLGNLCSGLAMTLLAPMVLARTGQNAQIFSWVQSAGAIGGVVGGVLMSVWGGFKRRVHGVLLGWLWLGVFNMLLGLGPHWLFWLTALFLAEAATPLVNSSNQAIWQAKVAPDVQGRVFSARRLIAWITNPLTPLIAGPLADFVLEPAMRPGGALTPIFGRIVGTGPGTGMTLLIIFSGSLIILLALGSYLFRAVRDVEVIMPDHQAEVPSS